MGSSASTASVPQTLQDGHEAGLHSGLSESLSFLRSAQGWLQQHKQQSGAESTNPLSSEEERAYIERNLASTIELLTSPLLNQIVSRYEASQALMDTLHGHEDETMRQYIVEGFAGSDRSQDVSVYSLHKSLRHKLDRAFHKIGTIRLLGGTLTGACDASTTRAGYTTRSTTMVQKLDLEELRKRKCPNSNSNTRGAQEA